MAYLTPNSFYQLCRETEVEMDSKDFYSFFKEYISDDYNIYKMFNKFNLHDLIQKVILSSNEFPDIKIKKREYKNVEERKDDLSYVFEIKGKVKYHLYQDCESLHKGFRNFNTPIEFFSLENKEEAISELREWFIKNDFTVERYEKGEFHIETVIMRYNAYFPKKYKGLKELNENYKLLEIKGAGKSPKEIDVNVENILKKLAEYSEERKNLCNMIILDKFLCKHDYLWDKLEDEEIKEKIKSFNIDDEVFLKHYTTKFIKKFWKRHYEIKTEVLKLLNKLIQYKYDFRDKDFEVNFLEQYNLGCCHYCNNRKVNEILFSK